MARQLGIPGIAGLLPGELIIDLFAGGGGASDGIRRALGREPDIAINHDPDAIKMHEANHPATDHRCQSVYHREVHPRELVRGRPVGLLWLSPDCRHFSRAKGAAPVSASVRGLCWIGLRWAKFARPRVVVLENVPEFQSFGPLIDRGDGKLVPNKARAGEYFRAFVREWRRYGYVVEWQTLVAADYGAPTTRKRLFLIARCDGEPIVWPEASHGKDGVPRPWRAAAECIDWTVPCPSIFERKRPLVDASCRRLARGVHRYVFNGRPFLIQCGYGERAGQAPRCMSVDHPLGTVVAGGAKHALAAPYIVPLTHSRDLFRGRSVTEPLATITTANRGEQALAAPVVVRLGHGDKQWNDVREPLTTVLAQGNHHGLGVAFLAKHNLGATGQDLRGPLHTITGVDTKALTTAFLVSYYSSGTQDQSASDPLGAVTTRARHALVTGSLEPSPDLWRAVRVARWLRRHCPEIPIAWVPIKGRRRPICGLLIDGVPWLLVDLGMRMMLPVELAAAQGFSPDYILTGTKSQQIARIGNSVPPPFAEAIVAANVPPRKAVAA